MGRMNYFIMSRYYSARIIFLFNWMIIFNVVQNNQNQLLKCISSKTKSKYHYCKPMQMTHFLENVSKTCTQEILG